MLHADRVAPLCLTVALLRVLAIADLAVRRSVDCSQVKNRARCRVSARRTLFVAPHAVVSRQQALDIALECRNALRYCCPDDIRINVEIPVHEMMPHPDDQSPRYGGVTLAKFRGQVTARFAEDLKPADHPSLCAFIGIERLAGALIPLDTGNGIQDIQQAGAIASHA